MRVSGQMGPSVRNFVYGSTQCVNGMRLQPGCEEGCDRGLAQPVHTIEVCLWGWQIGYTVLLVMVIEGQTGVRSA